MKSSGFLRLDSQEDLMVNKPWGNSLATGYSSEREAAAGCEVGALAGHGFSGTACTPGRGTACDWLDGSPACWCLVLLPKSCSLPCCSRLQGGPASPGRTGLGTGRLPVFYGCGREQLPRSPASPGMTARAGEPFPVPAGAPALMERGGVCPFWVAAEGRGGRADCHTPPPSEHWDAGAQQDGGGNRNAPD